MATAIKRIEKEFFLKVLYNEQLPIRYFQDRSEYILLLDKPVKNEMVFRVDRPIEHLKPRSRMDLKFDFQGQLITFMVEPVLIKDSYITCGVPEFLYKDLVRSASRTTAPAGMKAWFSFLGDHYDLSFPRITGYEAGTISEMVKDFDPRNLSELIGELSEWAGGCASGHKQVIFKDARPAAFEERIIAETGKILFLPDTLQSFPQTDPYPRKRLITLDIFRRYLESNGTDPAHADAACAAFITEKRAAGFFSDAWVPILFQEYVVGYIRAWINQEGMRPLDFAAIETMYQFAQVLSYSLKAKGYFERGRVKNKPFGGKIIDISVSGLLFAYPQSPLTSALLPESRLTVQLICPRRTVTAEAKVARRWRDQSIVYLGCQFEDIAPENIRFLFEYLYGRPFTDEDMAFLYGQV
jgi:hypothetical protein